MKSKTMSNKSKITMKTFDLDHTLINLSNSVLKHFGVDPFHHTIKEIDDILKNHQKVAVILLDGLGTYIRKIHPYSARYLNEHFFLQICSTFPPTTVAATNGFLSARYPIETGWMSWTQYFPDYQKNINVFTNRENETNILIKPKEENILSTYCAYENIIGLINKTNNKEIAKSIFPFPLDEKGPKNLKENRRAVKQFLNDHERCFLYCYHIDPDNTIHHYGVNSYRVGHSIRKLVRYVKKLVNDHKDTLFLVIADHGLIDVNYLDINDHPDLVSTLSQNMSMEKRCPTFFVKEGQKDDFCALFKKYYGEYFDLYSKQEVYDLKIFGEGKPHPYVDNFIGDFLAIAKDKKSIYDSKAPYCHLHKAAHAGGNKKESLIDISAFNI